MSELPSIIHTDVIPEKWDKFWSGAQTNMTDMKATDVVILSKPFVSGGEDDMLLAKMMQACKLSPDDYLVLQPDEENAVSWHSLRDKTGAKTIVLLGLLPEDIGVSAMLMPHQVSRFGGANWIVTSSLQELNARPEIKRHLWQYGLKPVFIDKSYG